MLLQACATTDDGNGQVLQQNRVRDCPFGTIQICESRNQREPSRGGDEEIPAYERCRCEPYPD